MKKHLFTIVTIMACTISTFAQDSLQVSVGADVISKYVWRGIDQGSGASIQPNLGVSFKGLSLSIDGSASIATPSINEIDIELSYEIGNVSFGITDYYNTNSENSSYSDYTNNHTFEFNIAYTISDNVPLTLSWNTMFLAGKEDEYNDNDKRMYSSYFNASYDFDVHGVTLTPAIGINPWESQYYDKFGVLDITLTASKELKLTDSFALPIYAQAIVSPVLDKAYIVFGITF